MASDKFEVRISVRSLLIVLLLAVAPFSIVGFYAIGQSDQSMERAIGNQFQTIAESHASRIGEFIHDRVLQVGAIAAAPEILDAVLSANQSYQGQSEDAVIARITSRDKAWNTPAAEGVVKDILASRASRLVRRHRELDPRMRRITVTDGRGATIAATHKTIDYYQADEEYWQDIYAQGRGAVSITDVLYDEVTKSNYIGIGVPVLEEGSNRFLGTVDTLIDVTSLFPTGASVTGGSTPRVLLVKDDGTVISGPGTTLSMKVKSEEFAALADALGTARGRQAGYLVAGLRDAGRTMIAHADTGLKRDYQKLDWVVLVSQNAREALAPVRFVGRLIAFQVLVGLAMVTLLFAYFVLHRRWTPTEIEVLRSAGSRLAEQTPAAPAGEASHTESFRAGR